MQTTTAAILTEQNKNLCLETLSLPDLKPGQVLVKVCATGICHTQLNEKKGIKGPDRFLPHTLGHEASGIVEKIGDGVSKVSPGDHVIMTWIKGDGRDVPSTVYRRDNGDDVNSGAITTFMTYTIASENRLVKIPKDLPFDIAALFGCAIPTGMGVVINNVGYDFDGSIIVFGVGGVGLCAVMGACLTKSKRIIAVDCWDDKLALAKKIGAHHCINFKKENVADRISEIVGSSGVDVAIEASGNIDAMHQAIQTIKSTGKCYLAGNVKKGLTLNIDPYDLISGKKIFGTWGGECQPDRDIPKWIDLYQQGKLPLSYLNQTTYRLSEVNQAMHDLETGQCIRPMIILSE